jgi:hypothetical protein
MAVLKLSGIAGVRDHTSLLTTDPLIVPLAAGDCLITVAEFLQAAQLLGSLAQGTTLTHGTSPVGTPLTTVAGTVVPINTSAGTVEAKLPTPALGISVSFLDLNSTWDANTFKLTPNGGESINGAAASLICNQRSGFGGAYCFDGTNWTTFGNLLIPGVKILTDADYTLTLADAGRMLLFPSGQTADRQLLIDTDANVNFQVGGAAIMVGTLNTAHRFSIAATTGATTKIGSSIGGVSADNQVMKVGKSTYTNWNNIPLTVKKTDVNRWWAVGDMSTT